MNKIDIGSKVRVVRDTKGDVWGRSPACRIGQVGLVVNNYSAYPEEDCPFGVEFETADPDGYYGMGFAADELEVIEQ